MKIGVFGGTFNPVHSGHLSLAKSLIGLNLLDKILFVVSARPPHKNEVMPSAKQRYDMVCLALKGSDTLIPCDAELKRSGKSYTVETMPALRKEFPNDELYFITGADMFIDIPNWYMPEKLFQNEKLIVADRGNAFHEEKYILKKEEIIKTYRPHVQFAEIETPDISSSQNRSTAEKYKNFLPEAVYDYIKRNKLYE